ncbi:flagellar biosynthesis anti-sigma factor FlgM [Desulfosarcina ovata]|uniref:Negative regulator of flagellin synthesis n=1 Tax=Desulfosarcina ovata subsp. ovata TaxID=2752305 RepID=A0A5K8A7D3_9BACT|nr:flagellar biosynthesis anti-sigma factor FlgM [Desulfosarcina ovata]BBO88274.1 hypothetical protein DSCOOX_14540 [Desulfosarcina ovata subsp. ovata]
MDKETGDESKDKVAFSKDFSAADDGVRSIKDMPEIREDKVAAIRRRLASGKYRVEGDRIASSLLCETEENNEILKQIGIDGKSDESSTHKTEGK